MSICQSRHLVFRMRATNYAVNRFRDTDSRCCLNEACEGALAISVAAERVPDSRFSCVFLLKTQESRPTYIYQSREQGTEKKPQLQLQLWL